MTDNGATPLLIAAGIRGTLKLSDFWLSLVPTKTKGPQIMDQRLFSQQLRNGHLEVVQFLVESGANKDQGKTDTGATPLYIAAQNGCILKLSDFWSSLVPTKTKAPQIWNNASFGIAACQGHLEVVQFLVESGANKDQGKTDTGAR